MNSKDDLYKEKSKDRLTKNCKKKIQTTMIGALSSIEDHLGFLWGHKSDEALSLTGIAISIRFQLNPSEENYDGRKKNYRKKRNRRRN
jgi:hypothetical protein